MSTAPTEPPPVEPPPTVELMAQPTAKGTDHYIMSAATSAVLRDHSGKLGPKGETLTLGHCLTMNPADLIKAFGLTG